MEAYYAQFNFIQSVKWVEAKCTAINKNFGQTMEESDSLNDYYNCLIE